METSMLVCGILGSVSAYKLFREDDGRLGKFAFWFLLLLGCALFPVFLKIAIG